MSKEGLKSKPKKIKKLKKDAEATSETKSQEAAPPAESYVAGEVAGSLFSKKSNQSVTPLLSLFDTKACAVQPLYVPVVVTKRKATEAEDTTKRKAAAIASQAPEKKNKAEKKELSVAEKRVEDRESALTNADDDEKTKRSLVKNLKNNKSFEDEDMVTKQAKKKMIMAGERVKNKRTVFVGNLPVTCTKQMLKTCFKEFGQIESMRFRSVARADPTLSRKVAAIHRKVHPKRKSMNAYVLFKEQDSAAKALVRNGNEISNGFHIRVDLASKGSSHDKKKSVFVGNLPYDIEDEALREHFSECGTVEGVRIIRDHHSGIGKGFGYVLFQGSDAVQLALKLENSDLMGRKLRVKRCLTDESQRTQKKASFKPSESLKKGQLQKKNTFVGETADGTKTKKKKPKMKKKKGDF
ncbi:RNA-binding protein 34 [Mixophyes fleayi]|uniref:RNA-binding protein 34 n=1 Tax=Mixophyes fleayi TaxID=3061075 RepID=UPI003F4DE7FA